MNPLLPHWDAEALGRTGPPGVGWVGDGLRRAQLSAHKALTAAPQDPETLRAFEDAFIANTGLLERRQAARRADVVGVTVEVMARPGWFDPDGIEVSWVRTARAALRMGRDNGDGLADPDDQGLVDRLARTVQTAAGDWWRQTRARFAEVVGAEVNDRADRWLSLWPDEPYRPFDALIAWFNAYAAEVIGVRPAAEALGLRVEDCPEYAEIVEVEEVLSRVRAALTGGPIPWLSEALARELDTIHPETATAWRTAELGREEVWRTQTNLPDVPPLALGGWWWNGEAPSLWRHRRDAAPPAAYRAIGVAIWRARVRPEVEERHNRERATIAPALTLPLARARVSLIASVSVRPEDRRVVSGDHDTGLIVAPGVELAAWEAMTGTLHTLTARRAVAWLARVAWEAYNAGDRGVTGEGWRAVVQHDRSVAVEVIGGFDTLGLVVGAKHNAAGREVYQALEALTGVRLSAETDPAAGLTGALIAQLGRNRGGPGQPGIVRCTLSPWWSPGAVHALTMTADRVIVPILDVPPLDAISRQLHTLGAAMEERALLELATHAREVVTRDGVALDWRELAGDLDWRHGARLVDDWRNRGRWVQRGDRWMLGGDDPALKAAGDLIRGGGTMREHRAKGGRASAAAKRGEGRKRRR